MRKIPPKDLVIKRLRRNITSLYSKGGKAKVSIVDHEPFVGSHPKTRPFQKTIRIDNDIKPHWRPFIEFHERVEYKYMKGGMGYEQAHKIATEREKGLFKKRFGKAWKEKWRSYSNHVLYVARKEQGLT